MAANLMSDKILSEDKVELTLICGNITKTIDHRLRISLPGPYINPVLECFEWELFIHDKGVKFQVGKRYKLTIEQLPDNSIEAPEHGTQKN